MLWGCKKLRDGGLIIPASCPWNRTDEWKRKRNEYNMLWTLCSITQEYY